jgi:hypothetical protein
MKISTILIVLIAGLFMQCTSNSTMDISGSYVNQAQSEFGKDCDTLIITSDNSKNKTYTIESRTGYQKIRNGVLHPMEYKQEKWMATWDADKLLLSETELGRQIRFQPQKLSLLLGNSEYRKLK